MKSVTRRTFLRGALLSAGAAFGPVIKAPQAVFPVDPRARIAVATYPFRASIVAPRNQERNPIAKPL